MNSTISLGADLVLFNGQIITVDPYDSVANAVAIREGKIIEVGDISAIEKYIDQSSITIDLNGKTVVPGFIDSHAHMDITAANTKLAISCHIPNAKYIEVSGNVKSQSDILNRIKEKTENTPTGEWIICHGRFSLEVDGNSPEKEQLDIIAPNHPVMIRYGAHAYLLNQKALETAGINKYSPTNEDLEKILPGGRIWRDPKTGEPTGKAAECIDWILRDSNPWSYKQLRGAIKDILHEVLKYGVTSIYDFTSWSETTRIYQDLFKSGELPIRIHISPCIFGLMKSVDLDCLLDLGIQTGFGNEWLEFGSVKIFVDGDGKDENGNFCEWLRISQDQLNNLVLKAHKGGLRVMMHANIREGQKLAINSIESALKKYPKIDHRHRIEHFAGDYWPEGLERLKDLCIFPVPTPYSSYGWYGDLWLESAKPGEKVVVYRTLLDNGFMPPGNSDSVGTEPEALNPWWSIWCAVERKTRKGRSICPEEGVTIKEAIRMYTINSAYACFTENTRGSIEKGKLADMVVLSDDPLLIPIDKIAEIKAEKTIIGGKIIYGE